MAVFTLENKGTRGDGSKFEKIVNENRKAAAAYYTQRINNVLKAYTIEENNKNNEEYIQNFREALFDFFANQISDQFNTRLQTAMSMPNLTQIVQVKSTNSEGKEEIKKITTFRINLSNKQLKDLGNLFNVDPAIIQNLIKNSRGINEKGEVTVASASTIFGHIQEEFIQNTAETFLRQFTNYEQDLIKDIENIIIGAVSTGSKSYPYESSPFRSKGHLVGVDFGKNVLDENNQPKEHLELGAEFKIDLNYSNYKHNSKNFSDLRKQAAIENAYSNKSMEYGIQIKNVSLKESNFKYRGYAPLKERINEQYKKGEDLSFDNWKRTWNANYGLWFMMAKVSDNFIGILGPETVGVLFRDGYIWMDDFIKSYTLRYRYSAKYTKYNNDFEIRPILNQNDINAYKALNPRVYNLYEKQDEKKNDLSIGMSWTSA